MAQPNNATAAAQIDVYLQKVRDDIEITQNLDEGIDREFQMVSAEDMSLQEYRHPIQTDVGGQAAGYNPDTGTYPQGTGSAYLEFLVVPSSNVITFAKSELEERLEGPGSDGLTAVKPIARMMTKIKTKMAHVRNALAQGYNEGLLGTVDPSYAGGLVIPMANVPYGNRLLDLNNQYQICDVNFNVLGVVTVLAKSLSTGAGLDTITLDNVPAGVVAGCQFILMGYASGAPLGPQGLEYMISNSQIGDNDSIPRTNSIVQCPSANASSTLTLGLITVMDQRKNQALGSDQVATGARKYYTHYIQRATAHNLGFAKNMQINSEGKVKAFDIAPDLKSVWTIGGQMVLTDSMAGIDKLYDLSTANLRKVRYPGSQKMIPFSGGGYWWPRTSGANWSVQSDCHFQDCYNMYTKLPWSHVYAYNLYVNSVMSVGV